jgi:hypothetical protein
MSDWIKVSKIDAARRQLDAAIKLWFQDGDEVAIHTLMFAAYEILNALNQKQHNENATLLGFVKKNWKPEEVEEIMQLVKAPMKFFKHADRDPHAVLEFSPSGTDVLLPLVVSAFMDLGEQITDLQHAFLQWLSLHNEAFKDLSKPFEERHTSEDMVKIRRLTKREFLNEFFHALARDRSRGV